MRFLRPESLLERPFIRGCVLALAYRADVRSLLWQGRPVNYCGSYRRLLGNAKSAMVGAIEIYNKPRSSTVTRSSSSFS